MSLSSVKGAFFFFTSAFNGAETYQARNLKNTSSLLTSEEEEEEVKKNNT